MRDYRVLIVDDDPVFGKLFQVTLQSAQEAIYRPMVVSSAEDALECISTQGQFDIILLDYMLPGMNGADFLREFRKFNTETLVICLSVSKDYRVVQNSLKEGADEYIPKEDIAKPHYLERAVLSALEKREYKLRIARLEVTKQRMDAIRTTIQTIHHELNNPMAVLKLLASRMATTNNLSREDCQKYTHSLIENVDRMTVVLRKLGELHTEIIDPAVGGPKTFILPDLPEENTKP
ncbi:MAG: response regulator [bacterium]